MRVSPQGPDRLRAYASTAIGAIPSELPGMELASRLQRSELSHKRSVTLELMASEFLAKDKLLICARRVFHFDHPRAARGETQKAIRVFHATEERSKMAARMAQPSPSKAKALFHTEARSK